MTIEQMEEKLAREWYGCSYDELNEDERGEVTFEAAERTIDWTQCN